ncbi:hypothetical protein [Streptomyces phaeolivaceus]|uniref:hypothetical protein n=1 Tax=Streptomyces phaeolivaceus TaxID=2653200 RepID=UPI001D053C27|nr:hypothetical protein [Streptomyces phaeolivaceus]
MLTGIAYIHAGEDVNPGSPSTRSATSASTCPGLLNFAFHKGCALQPAVFSHTWVGDTRATTARDRAVGTTVYANGNCAVGTPQALSYWPRLGTEQVGELWGLTEHIRAGTTPRTVFAVGFDDSAVMNLH